MATTELIMAFFPVFVHTLVSFSLGPLLIMLCEKSIISFLVPSQFVFFNTWANAITSTSGKQNSLEMILAIG